MVNLDELDGIGRESQQFASTQVSYMYTAAL